MTKMFTLLTAATLALGLSAPAVAHASDETDIMACTVSVQYTLSNVLRLSYDKDFEVSPSAPFSDDFSTVTRLRFFDAAMTHEGGVPVVSIRFDADVSVFNAVTFGASLRVKDESNGETTSGDSGFFTSVPGAAGGHRTSYTLTCKRAPNA